MSRIRARKVAALLARAHREGTPEAELAGMLRADGWTERQVEFFVELAGAPLDPLTLEKGEAALGWDGNDPALRADPQTRFDVWVYLELVAILHEPPPEEPAAPRPPLPNRPPLPKRPPRAPYRRGLLVLYLLLVPGPLLVVLALWLRKIGVW